MEAVGGKGDRAGEVQTPWAAIALLSSELDAKTEARTEGAPGTVVAGVQVGAALARRQLKAQAARTPPGERGEAGVQHATAQ